jgi:hypothetical protein
MLRLFNDRFNVPHCGWTFLSRTSRQAVRGLDTVRYLHVSKCNIHSTRCSSSRLRHTINHPNPRYGTTDICVIIVRVCCLILFTASSKQATSTSLFNRWITNFVYAIQKIQFTTSKRHTCLNYKVPEAGENCIMRSCRVLTPHKLLVRLSSQEE